MQLFGGTEVDRPFRVFDNSEGIQDGRQAACGSAAIEMRNIDTQR